MSTGMHVLVVPVKDLDRAKTLYATLLGAEPYVDTPYYVGFRVGGAELGLDPHGHSKGMAGPVAYWRVDDINAALASLAAAGATVEQQPTDVGGRLIASVRDTDGNVTGLTQDT